MRDIVEVSDEHPLPASWGGSIVAPGCRWAWVRERRLDEAEGRYDMAWACPARGRSATCRQPGCDAPAAASLMRGTVRRVWWNYCVDHLYGRVIIRGEVFGIRAIDNAEHPPA